MILKSIIIGATCGAIGGLIPPLFMVWLDQRKVRRERKERNDAHAKRIQRMMDGIDD